MAEYTKGEWEVKDGTQVVCGERLVANTGGWSTNYQSTKKENEANAHLISAASELYEALKLVYSNPKRLSTEELVLIGQAIAKANGQSTV